VSLCISTHHIFMIIIIMHESMMSEREVKVKQSCITIVISKNKNTTTSEVLTKRAKQLPSYYCSSSLLYY
jgi:hypothetical protein